MTNTWHGANSPRDIPSGAENTLGHDTERQVTVPSNHTPSQTIKQCEVCGNEIPEIRARSYNVRYCSRECRSVRAKSIQRPGMTTGLPTATVGALHELVVAAELMRSGWHVFRALSPACPCDLIVTKPAMTTILVEVRTGWRNPEGELVYNLSQFDTNRADVLAIVGHDGEIRYYPVSPEEAGSK